MAKKSKLRVTARSTRRRRGQPYADDVVELTGVNLLVAADMARLHGSRQVVIEMKILAEDHIWIQFDGPYENHADVLAKTPGLLDVLRQHEK